jgi:hypothetical protein
MLEKGPGFIKRGDLTKRFLMDLPEGLFFVSNIYLTGFKPAIAEEVVPMSLRVKQWERIVKVGADRRLCYVFKSRHDYEIWMAQTLKLQKFKIRLVK